MKYTLLIGGIEKEISQELAEALLNSEGLRIQICKARDHSFADVFGVLDKKLKHSRELKFIDFQPNDDVDAGDILLVPGVGELRITSVDPQLDDGKLYALRAYISYPPMVVEGSIPMEGLGNTRPAGTKEKEMLKEESEDS